jgi:hypothetical protein
MNIVNYITINKQNNRLKFGGFGIEEIVPKEAIIVNELPNNVEYWDDYIYENGEIIYSPIERKSNDENYTDSTSQDINDIDKLQAQIAYTAMVTGTLI